MIKICIALFSLIFSTLTFAQSVIPEVPIVNNLEGVPVPLPVVTAVVAPVVPDWVAQATWAGDLRYRLAKTKEDIDEERTFQQLRARLGIKADVNPDVKMNLRLATGTSATSTNQTLGDAKDPGMARRNFGLDQAYLDWNFTKGTVLWLGRAPSPFWTPNKTQLVLDSDLNLEGFSVASESVLSEAKIFYSVGAFMISENYDTVGKTDVVDTGLWGAQVGYSVSGDFGEVKFHLAHFDFVNIRGKNILTLDKDAKTDIYSTPYDRYKGNLVLRPDLAIADYFFQSKFILREVGLEYKHQSSWIEATIFVDTVENTAADQFSRGTEYGLGLRKERLQLTYSIVKKQSESAVGAFTDGDSNGGGTDNRGTKINLNYQLSKKSRIDWNLYNAERGIDSVQRKFIATQLDFLVSF